MRQSWDSHETVTRQSQDSHVIVLRQSLYSHKTVVKWSWHSHETIMRQSWDSHETVMRQSWDRYETVMRLSWDSLLLYSSCRLCRHVCSCLFSPNLSDLKCILVGVWDRWPKSKHQNFKSTQWFSYKIWTKNSEEPIVYLHNWPLPEQHHFLKIKLEIHFLTFLNTDRNA